MDIASPSLARGYSPSFQVSLREFFIPRGERGSPFLSIAAAREKTVQFPRPLFLPPPGPFLFLAQDLPTGRRIESHFRVVPPPFLRAKHAKEPSEALSLLFQVDFLSSKGELVLEELVGKGGGEKGNKTLGEGGVRRRLPEISFCMNENSLTGGRSALRLPH